MLIFMPASLMMFTSSSPKASKAKGIVSWLNSRNASFVCVTYCSVRSSRSTAIFVGSWRTREVISYLIPMMVHIRLPTLDLYVGSDEGTSPLMIFLSVLPGVKMEADCVTLKVYFNFVANVCIESVIVPLSWCVMSRPIKSLGLVNLNFFYKVFSAGD